MSDNLVVDCATYSKDKAPAAESPEFDACLEDLEKAPGQ